MYEKFLDPIIENFTTGEYYREVYSAKQEYFKNKVGEVYEDDPEFEQRMCCFMDWYIFDRDLPKVDLPPAKYYYKKNRDLFKNEEIDIYRDLCSTIHSIFRLKRFTWSKTGLIVQDLFSKKKYKVVDPEINLGFSKGDIFECRLVPFKNGYEFSNGFCFHPVEMRSFIVSEIKKVRYQDKAKHTKLVLQLAAMKLEHMRYQNIDVREIYSYNSKFRASRAV